MRYHALAADYDGTLAHDGAIDEATTAALLRFKSSGRKLLMVTGRELNELLDICPQVELFDHIVAENGALLYDPRTKEMQILGESAPPQLVAALRAQNVQPLSVGHVIIAMLEQHQATALEAIRELGLEHHVIFNKGSVMLLPSGINKATGLTAVLREVGLSRHNVIGVGDAENDHAFLNLCECAVAVANALPSLKERADLVMSQPRGAGVTELIDAVLLDELASHTAPRLRHAIRLGESANRVVQTFDVHSSNLLVCGTSGSGKSTLTTAVLEHLANAGYQFAIIDPEGDYTTMEPAISLGSPERAPLIEEVLDVLRDSQQNAIINLLGVSLDHRPEYFDQLLPRLLEMRARTGRPHWIVIDEAHHLLPTQWQVSQKHLPSKLNGTMYITVHPESISRELLDDINMVLAVGQKPDETILEFCEAAECEAPPMPQILQLASGEAILWRPGVSEPVLVDMDHPKQEHKRHSRKYTEGNLGAERSFYFRGPDNKLKLRASNLFLFLEMADGIDDETWTFHLERGDYSKWLAEQVKDTELGDEVRRIEGERKLSPQASRQAVRAAIEGRYTLPADKPSGLIDDVPQR